MGAAQPSQYWAGVYGVQWQEFQSLSPQDRVAEAMALGLDNVEIANLCGFSSISGARGAQSRIRSAMGWQAR